MTTEGAPPAQPREGGRRPRLLWASRSCLLDRSSGAAISVREMLHQIAGRGVDVRVLGATLFDGAGGGAALRERIAATPQGPGLVAVEDGPLSHRLVRTAHWRPDAMTLEEAARWLRIYRQLLAEERPDLVFFHGGGPIDWHVPGEAKAEGIPSAAYVANGAYRGTRWCRDVDLVLTDTEATAALYRERLGRAVTPLGKFIRPGHVVASAHDRTHVTFVSPVPAKGAVIVAQVAMWLERRRPDIRFDVVEGRGDWSEILERTSSAMGETRRALSNVSVTPTTHDMRSVYGRSRVLFAPSLWWESGARVIVEAMLNGIPVVATNHGGSPDLVGPCGTLVELPAACHEPPYTRILPPEAVARIAETLARFYDDEEGYRRLSGQAAARAQESHGLERSAARLFAALGPFLDGAARDG